MSQKIITILSVLLLLIFSSCSSKKNLQKSNTENAQKSVEASNAAGEVSQAKKQPNMAVDNLKLDLENMLLLINDNIAEINRLKSELEYLQINQNKSMLTPQEILFNPFDVYNKKIILNNGTTVFGNITYQDDLYVQAETLIGTLSLSKSEIVRVVDHKMLEIQEAKEIIDIVKNPNEKQKKIPQNLNLAEIVLLGEFQETLDENKNTILSGEVQNTGTKRADFIKVNFTIYKDRKYNEAPKEYTVFIDGSIHEFENNIVSNSSLSPNETGGFALLIPNDFGPFISYSYNIDWEQYD
ncbi:MAG: hypothetical protein CMG64_00245 [Candidatus Marinimicrobia bacterium]|nr:hypothetical protein [Candidatus Neomarinimicrobiota bacterium]|tara:strand:+ start:37162 stop:38052 length:891 start_codon:yes stop_codon:yes gene_type:complete